jgi:hypothetical protein
MAQLEAPCAPEADCLFAAGYLDHGGPPGYLRHLLDDVRPCEGEWWIVYDNGYMSALQFTPGTWAGVARKTQLWDPLDPYHVGANVAALINDLERAGRSPGSTGGWPTCWWRGLTP